MPRAVNSPRPVDIVAARLDQQLELMMQELAIEAAQASDLAPSSPATSLPATPTSSRRPSLPPFRPPELAVPPLTRSSHHSDADSGRGSTYSNPPRSPLPSSNANASSTANNNTTSMMTGGSTGSMSMALTLEDQGAAGNDFLAQMLGDLHTLYASDEDDDVEAAEHRDALGYPHPDAALGDSPAAAPSAEHGLPPAPATMGRRPSASGQGASAAQALARNRARAVHEIVQTEATYVEMLSALVELVVRPLREALASGSAKKLGYSADDLNKIFGNVEEILGLHVTLLDGLRERYSLWTNDTKISDLFMTILPFLKMYQLYMSMYANAVVTLTRCRKSSSDLHRLIGAAENHQRFKGLQILSFLILPIQRIPRYILLLENLAKYTPESHPDFEPCTTQKRAIAIHSRLSGRPDKLPSLVAPARKFLGESVDFSIRSKALASAGLGLDARRAVAVFLFTDVLVIAKRLQTSAPVVALGGSFASSVPPSESEKWEWRDEVFLPRAWISDEPDADPNEFAIRVVGSERAVTVFATTRAIRDEWRDKIQAAIDASRDTAGTLGARGRSLSRSGPQSLGVITSPMDAHVPPSPTSSTWSGRSGSDRASRSSHGTSWFGGVANVPASPSAYSMRRPSITSLAPPMPRIRPSKVMLACIVRGRQMSVARACAAQVFQTCRPCRRCLRMWMCPHAGSGKSRRVGQRAC
ncbi:hypothetical protein BCR44DRAFT_1458574 [Catenaria anguillulae PL171]|uniref:DH domain-containing protein n=1 Tax=Catenaria anguillulae PL171 TaxID=765915 RepID=A0A1Y2HZ41_9FUNG|nr:hypothetical protein BCR44DRAFT_1458574 [Catenaria anguillulae PL171]